MRVFFVYVAKDLFWTPFSSSLKKTCLNWNVILHPPHMYINIYICFVILSCLRNRLCCSGFALSRFCREYWLQTNGMVASIRSVQKGHQGRQWSCEIFPQLADLISCSGTQQDMIRSDWHSANAPGEQLSLLKVDLLYHRVSPVTCNTKAHLFFVLDCEIDRKAYLRLFCHDEFEVMYIYCREV